MGLCVYLYEVKTYLKADEAKKNSLTSPEGIALHSSF